MGLRGIDGGGGEIPDRWVGQTVLVSMISTEVGRDGSPLPLSSTIKKGELKAVTALGIVAALTPVTDPKPDPATCFYPWSAVLGIALG